MHDYKLRIEFDVEFYSFKADAYIYDISFGDMPKVLDADHYVPILKDLFKRFKGYKRLMLTISGHTAKDGQYKDSIYEVRYLDDQHDGVRRNVFDQQTKRFADNKWHPAQLKDLPTDIKECVTQINQLQLRQKQTA